MAEDDELVREFLLESSENLNQLDRDFVALEKSPGDPHLLGAIFRAVHTIKGNSGFFGFAKLEMLTHAGETLLSLLRDGAVRLDEEITTALLAMLDGVRRLLASIEATGTEGDVDNVTAIAVLKRLGRKDVPIPSMAAASMRAASGTFSDPPAVLAPRIEVLMHPEVRLDVGVDLGLKGPSVADSSIRVDVGLLDRVMNLVGELVLARNQILQLGAASRDASFVKASQRLNLLTTELQEGVMKTRLQPISSVWNRFPRLVRDLSQACGKRVKLEMEGTDTELDRTIIEAIKDPLTHAVRNAVDHGVESPERRRAAGKPETATLHLAAFHEGGKVNIEISDDGAGLATERIRDRAVERGLVTAERAVKMNDREIAQLIFLPGFSTAQSVTSVSGRGVGMDVVKTNIERIGGTVDLTSRPGAGTTVKIKIPLTLAIIPALVVTCAEGRDGGGGALVEHRFAIPQVNLLELVRLEGPEQLRQIERLHGTTVYRLRGNLLPLVSLHRTLDMSGAADDGDVVNIVVLQADDRQFGLIVDGIIDTEEIVVKPLGKELKGLDVFAGATIMGDGRVTLILDVPGIAQRASVLSASRGRTSGDRPSSAPEAIEARESLLLFRVGANGRMALPLSLVARLEEMPRELIERSAGQEVVQYRGAILPLIALGPALLDEAQVPASSDALLQVIVCAQDGLHVGLVVEQILDVAEEAVTVRSPSRRDGLLGSIVAQGRVTDLVDVAALLARVRGGAPAATSRKDAA